MTRRWTNRRGGRGHGSRPRFGRGRPHRGRSGSRGFRDRSLGGDFMLHVRDGGFRDARKLVLDDACGLRFHGRGRSRFLGRAIDGEERFARPFVLEPLPFLLCRPLGGAE